LILSAEESEVLNVIDLACNINESVKHNEPFEIVKKVCMEKLSPYKLISKDKTLARVPDDRVRFCFS
jgi:hypothetical protein